MKAITAPVGFFPNMSKAQKYWEVSFYAFVFLTSAIGPVLCSTFVSTTYGRQECSGESCGWQQVIQGQETMGLTSCAIQCHGDTSCIGFSTETIVASPQSSGPPASCYIHRACSDAPNPQECSSQTTTQYEMYSKNTVGAESGSLNTIASLPSEVSTVDPEWETVEANPCQNNGTWDVRNDKCSCHGGWVGPLCHRYAYSCLELIEYGYPLEDIKVTIHPNTSGVPFVAVCGLREKFVITHIFINSGRANFNRSWDDFERGFYIDENHSWLGLMHANALTRAGLTKVSLSVIFTTSQQNMVYTDTHFGDSSTNYEIMVGTSARSGPREYGDIADCLGLSNGAAFSTFDSETCDCPALGCTGKAGAAWWFVGCSVQCNPLAPKYENPPKPRAADRINVPGFNLWGSSYADKLMHVKLRFKEKI